MFAPVTAWSFADGSGDGSYRRERDVILPVHTAQPGFCGYFAVRTGRDELLTIALYESREHAEDAYRALAPLWRREHGPDLDGLQRFAGVVEMTVQAGSQPRRDDAAGRLERWGLR